MLRVAFSEAEWIFFAAVIVVAVTTIIAAILVQKKTVLEKRIGYRDKGRILTLAEIEHQTSFRKRVLLPAVDRVTNFLQKISQNTVLERIEKQLLNAGVSLNAGQFLLLQLVSLFIGGAVGVALQVLLVHMTGVEQLALPVVGLIVGYSIPRIWLNRRATKRQLEVLRSLPAAIDIITMCVRAGLGFDSALQEVCLPIGEGTTVLGIDEALRREFGLVSGKIALGVTPVQALREMGESTGVPEVVRFANVISHAQEFGTPISTILEIQSSQLREERKNRAEELGAKAPLKMLFPMVGCIFPTLFVILLGPAALQVIKSFVHG